MVDRQVFGVTIIIYGYDSPDLRLVHNALFDNYKTFSQGQFFINFGDMIPARAWGRARSSSQRKPPAQAYLPPSYVFSHWADSCSTHARASAFLVKPSICVSRPCGGVTRTYQPFPLFNRTGSNLVFGVEAGIVELCDALHQSARTNFLRLYSNWPTPENRGALTPSNRAPTSWYPLTQGTGEHAWNRWTYW